ncbi:MAG: hypothetical protein ACRDX8_05150 [Acidimicrobiales bacterium]
MDPGELAARIKSQDPEVILRAVLFLGLLHEQAFTTSEALGVDLATARAAQEALDRAALSAISLDPTGLPIGALTRSRRRPRMSSAARSVIGCAVRKARRGQTTMESRHIALALLECKPPDPSRAHGRAGDRTPSGPGAHAPGRAVKRPVKFPGLPAGLGIA